jgi:hypothetical protein
MDAIQQLCLDRIEDSVARHNDRPRLVGRLFCLTVDCGTPISQERQALGARYCIDCQTFIEQQQKQRRA